MKKEKTGITKKTKTPRLTLPDGVRPGSLLTVMYENDELPYHCLFLSQQTVKTHPAITVAFIYPEDGAELTAIDLMTGKDSSGCKAMDISICTADTIREMLEDEGYYAKGEPHTIFVGRVESDPRRH